MSSGGFARSERPPLLASVVPLVSVWRVDRPFDYLVPEELADWIVPGCVVAVRFGNRRVRAVVRSAHRALPERELAPIDRVVVAAPVAGPPLGGLLDFEARRYITTTAASWSRAVPPRVRVTAAPTPEFVGKEIADLPAAMRPPVDAIRDNTSGVWVVRPDPRLARERLISALVGAVRNGSALVAVPEVTYGSLVLDSLSSDYPDLLRTDSAVSDTARSAAVMRLAAGRGLGAGGRSIVHAPAPDLELLLVDEEHHPSFKEDRSPRYDARRSAVERARLHGSPCVFVSSTPSVEAGFKALTGEWGLVTPPRGAEREARPLVEVVPADPKRAITGELFHRIRDTLNAGRRVAILVPAAGFARAMWCSNCRRSLRCPRCESGLFVDDAETLHVHCAVCGFESTAPAQCPSCGASAWRFLGSGSRRHEEQLAKAFPRARVQRVDPENMDTPAGSPDIYVTTWIGTKPAVRPDVSLVAVLETDALIRRPDFRAAENAYQALAAMAEWAGRASAGGRLVLQSDDGGHHAIQAVVRASYDYFLERELNLRKDLSYPPFSELIRMWASRENSNQIEEAAAVARNAGARVLGPVAARRGSRKVIEALVKCADAQVVADELRTLMSSGRRAFSVDVDPR
jgi:primosomal protein N' (replication factor Y) (superfamily II helicase)